VPSRDFISMPAFAGFKVRITSNNVAFHELTHCRATKSRLDRDLKNRFGSRNYAAEELIAELGAAFLCAEFGFDGDVRNAGYVADWIELFEGRQAAFFYGVQPGIQGRGLSAWPGACRSLGNCRLKHRGPRPRRRSTLRAYRGVAGPTRPTPTQSEPLRTLSCRLSLKGGIRDFQFQTMRAP